jgi:hypothetical protein
MQTFALRAEAQDRSLVHSGTRPLPAPDEPGRRLPSAVSANVDRVATSLICGVLLFSTRS